MVVLIGGMTKDLLLVVVFVLVLVLVLVLDGSVVVDVEACLAAVSEEPVSS